MKQDLRTLFKEEGKKEKYSMKAGHEDRFLERLNTAIPKSKKPAFFYVKIAASVILLLGLGAFLYQHFNGSGSVPSKNSVVGTEELPNETQIISLGDLSPELEKVENYYVTNINLELAKLEVSHENRALVDSFMERLAHLNAEYNTLITELNTIGPNDQTISALIKNLQLRLQLFYKLKEKLNELKSSKNEEITT